MLIEIHMIQNHSPANLNRDDLGAPKTCYFGGVLRSRISSQCIKRSIRNPGRPENPDDPQSKRKGASSFAQAMGEHIGVRTKLFPWLVQQELKGTEIPEDEHDRIVMAAQRIATAKEKEQNKAEKADTRPTSPQLISMGRGDAKRFVAKLADLRKAENGAGGTSDRYAYFLNPRVGFEEMVREHLGNSDLNEKVVQKIVKASWLIAKCRMSALPHDEGDQDGQEQTSQEASQEILSTSPPPQPGQAEATRIADVLEKLASSDDQDSKKKFKDLTKSATNDEKTQIKEDAPTIPTKQKDFVASLRESLSCRAVDFALFGRMTTSDAFDDIEAAMQVAHAISTHAAVPEVDYWTALDDFAKAGGGSGHLGEAMFSSACFYKYFSLDWDQLFLNLAGPEPDPEKEPDAHGKWTKEIKPSAVKLAAATLGHFIRATALINPTGKQNSFAAHNPPDGILIEINRPTPISYANAFAKPVQQRKRDMISQSIAQLGQYVHDLDTGYGKPAQRFWFSPNLLYRLSYVKKEKVKEGEKEREKKEEIEIADQKVESLDMLIRAVIKAIDPELDWVEVQKAVVNSGAAS
ncbi:type I-E CRISPR-associated protein Cas7/Cse4/CasC [Candidatus Sumerlaeota bacterium]|nr:type I-E CRISPR-associated protein Cas7/Cse4/CasC [Candidatus Sumerlaeota bacterium]